MGRVGAVVDGPVEEPVNALTLTLFVSAVLLAYGLVQFTAAWLRKDHEHADRLAVLPLADDVCAPVDPVESLEGVESDPAGAQP